MSKKKKQIKVENIEYFECAHSDQNDTMRLTIDINFSNVTYKDYTELRHKLLEPIEKTLKNHFNNDKQTSKNRKGYNN